MLESQNQTLIAAREGGGSTSQKKTEASKFEGPCTATARNESSKVEGFSFIFSLLIFFSKSKIHKMYAKSDKFQTDFEQKSFKFPLQIWSESWRNHADGRTHFSSHFRPFTLVLSFLWRSACQRDFDQIWKRFRTEIWLISFSNLIQIWTKILDFRSNFDLQHSKLPENRDFAGGEISWGFRTDSIIGSHDWRAIVSQERRVSSVIPLPIQQHGF